MRRFLATLVLIVIGITGASCGGSSASPSTADKKACVTALYKLDVRVWVLHQPLDANLGPAAQACYWVSRDKLRAAAAGGMADYQARLKKLFG